MTHLRELLLHGTRVTGGGLGSAWRTRRLTRVELPQQTDAAIQAGWPGSPGSTRHGGGPHHDQHRPATADDVTKFIFRGPVTDAVVTEVRAFPNLTHLYLRTDKMTPRSCRSSRRSSWKYLG